MLAVYREPFSLGAGGLRVAELPSGTTLLEMRKSMPGLPEDFDRRGVICINGVEAPSALWGAIRPKPEAVTEVTFHYQVHGGGDGDKNVFATIAAIALSVATGWIATGGIAAKFGTTLFSAYSVSALVLAAGVSLAGSLLLSALIPPPTVPQGPDAKRTPGAASAQGNILEPNAPIPRVLGERKVFPPLASEPLTYFDGPDEVVEAAYILAGPHRLNDIKIGAAAAADMSGVELETREGWPGDPIISLLQRQARTESLNGELRGQTVGDDNRTLESEAGDLLSALPQPQIVASRQAPDEHQIQIVLPQGLQLTDKGSGDGIAVRIPLRIRARLVGTSTWRNLPELHFAGRQLGQMRATLRMVWTDEASVTPEVSSGIGWVEARRQSAGQTAAPATDDWVADPYFGTTGPVWMDAGNLGTTGVQWVQADRWTASVFLRRADWPPGRYEFEIVRGAAFRSSSYSATSYQYDGSVWDFFGYRGTPGEIAMSKEQLIDTLYLARSVSIWNEHPLPSRDVAIIAVRARNRALDAVSAVAGGWVKDWDGTGWRNWTVTSRPAPHLRDILTGADNLDPIPEELIDDAGLVAWRDHCASMGYVVNALLEDQTVEEAARIVASCGYAQPLMTNVWGVTYDRDRSAESPSQIFSGRNMRDFQWTKAFARLPEGFRVNYRDASRDYDLHQISIFRPGHSDDSGRMEQVTYEGLVTEAEVRRKALYDQLQAEHRNKFYSFEAPVESILCERNDLIGVQHHMLSRWASSARVVEVVVNGGDTEAIRTDTPLLIANFPFMDEVPNLAAEENLANLGMRSGVAARHQNGTEVYFPSTADGEVIQFNPPIPVEIEAGSLIASGPINSEVRRLLVFGIEPRQAYSAVITAVDEAPEIWEKLNNG